MQYRPARQDLITVAVLVSWRVLCAAWASVSHTLLYVHLTVQAHTTAARTWATSCGPSRTRASGHHAYLLRRAPRRGTLCLRACRQQSSRNQGKRDLRVLRRGRPQRQHAARTVAKMDSFKVPTLGPGAPCHGSRRHQCRLPWIPEPSVRHDTPALRR